MRPADLHWQPLTNSQDGSYDSLAMAWDILTSRGSLSQQTAAHLLQTAERFGPFIQRRVFALPVPGEVPRAVRTLTDIRENLDIGFLLNVYGPPQGFPERELWILCARLGLSFGAGGSFDWLTPGVTLPLLSVTPFGLTDAFSLANVHSGMHHEGVTIGFSVPLCISPSQALQGCFHVANTLARELRGETFDDENRRLTPRIQEEYRTNLRQALAAFSQTGMTTGSPEAIKLFDS